MKNAKKLGVLLFALMALAACGESFRGANANSSNNEEILYYDANGNPVYDTSGTSSTIRFEKDTVLFNRIKGFDMTLTGESGNKIKAEARLTISCDESRTFEVTTSVDSMSSLKVVSLGTSGDYTVQNKCLSKSCSQLLISVQRSDRPSSASKVLMVVGQSGGKDGVVLYTPRQSTQVSGEKIAASTSEFEDDFNCRVTDNDEQSFLEDLIDNWDSDDSFGENLWDTVKDRWF